MPGLPRHRFPGRSAVHQRVIAKDAIIIPVDTPLNEFVLSGKKPGILGSRKDVRYLITFSPYKAKSGTYVSIKAVPAGKSRKHPIELGHFFEEKGLELYRVKRMPIFTRRQLEFIELMARKFMERNG